MLNKILIRKKAQIGETITWVVATIIIIVILAFSIFVTSSLTKGKGISGAGNGKEIGVINEKDLIAAKSLSSYLLTKDASGEIVFEQIKTEGNLNDFNGELAEAIFEGLYSKDYSHVIWFGVVKNVGLFNNDYFGSRGKTVQRKGGDTVPGYYSSVGEKLMLDENKWLELILMDD